MRRFTPFITLCLIAACGAGAYSLFPDDVSRLAKQLQVDAARIIEHLPDDAAQFIEQSQKDEKHPEGGKKQQQIEPQREEKPPSPEALAAFEKIKPHLEEAKKAAAVAANMACDRVRAFFVQRQKGARSFAEEALSFRSKWELLKGGLDLGPGHQHFLHGLFEEKVFSQKELTDLFESVVAEYLETIKGIENSLLVTIRADLEDSAIPDLRGVAWTKTNEAFRGEYAAALKTVTSTVSTDLAVLIGREAVAWVASDVAAKIATSLCITVAQRMGVSAAITSSGIVSGVTTLGLSIVAGLIIDELLDWVLKSLGYDAVEEVEDLMVVLIEEFEGFLLLGDEYEKPKPGEEPKWDFNNPDTFSDATRRRNEIRVDRMQQRQQQHVKSTRPCKGFSGELSELYAVRARLQESALRNLILKGGQ